jgi:hypothetical protein
MKKALAVALVTLAVPAVGRAEPSEWTSERNPIPLGGTVEVRTHDAAIVLAVKVPRAAKDDMAGR